MSISEILASIGANIQLLHVVLFAVGIICMVVELFEPGMGVFGIVGVLVMVIDIFILADNWAQGLVLFAVLAILLVAFVVTLVVLSSHGILPKNLVLKDATSNSEGYVASAEKTVKIGDTGVAATHLRPAGKAEFGYLTLDVVANGEFIERGTHLIVISVDANRILVKELDEKE